MKYLLLTVFMLIPCLSHAQGSVEKRSLLGPEISSGTAAGAEEVIISSGSNSAGRRNCLTSFSVISDAAYTVQILDAGTVIFEHTFVADSGIVMDWPDTSGALCGSANSELTIDVSAGVFSLNFRGYRF